MIKRIVIVLIGILIVVLGRGLFYYSGFYHAPPSDMPSFEHIVVPAAPSTEFSDTYTPGQGTILFDLTHDNAFDIEELNVLISRLVSRGLTIEFLSKEEETNESLEEKLEVADAFIIVCPQEEFSAEEREAVDGFLNNGGKLLLIADPTRSSKINSISVKFGLVFEPGYLYNMKENDANYRNIFVTQFTENEITKNLERIALYTAGSISSDNWSIAFVDENTLSSVIETRKGLSPIALSNESNVLTIYDLTFITEPYNGILDNNQLISNIANWLTSPAEEEVEEEEEEEAEETE
ncbi:hypothetical protein ES703_37668 [subsurface metagenome]